MSKTDQSFRRQISDLELVYTRKELAKKFGVSTSTISRWASGKGKPRNKKQVSQKVNRIYGQKKKQVEVKRTEKIQRSKARKAKKRASQEELTIPNLIEILMDELESDGGIDEASLSILYSLEEKGYIAARPNTQEGDGYCFVIQGDIVVDTWGKKPRIIGFLNGYGDNGGRYTLTQMRLGSGTFEILAPGIKKKTNIDDKHEAFNDIFMKTIKPKKGTRGFPEIYLGYYFDEGDET